jgi:molybdenum cofactor guanylyltransferase
MRKSAKSSSFSAVLLAAGRSSRMGRDKALLVVDGVPLWARQHGVLAQAGAKEIFLSARPEQEWVRGATKFSGLVVDAITNGGPLVGITAGLERSTHRWLAVLAVDLPRMSAAWFKALLADCKPGVGVVGNCRCSSPRRLRRG